MDGSAGWQPCWLWCFPAFDNKKTSVFNRLFPKSVESLLFSSQLDLCWRWTKGLVPVIPDNNSDKEPYTMQGILELKWTNGEDFWRVSQSWWSTANDQQVNHVQGQIQGGGQRGRTPRSPTLNHIHDKWKHEHVAQETGLPCIHPWLTVDVMRCVLFLRMSEFALFNPRSYTSFVNIIVKCTSTVSLVSTTFQKTNERNVDLGLKYRKNRLFHQNRVSYEDPPQLSEDTAPGPPVVPPSWQGKHDGWNNRKNIL